MSNNQAVMLPLLKSFALLTVGNVLSSAFSLLLVVMISRLRGAEELGRYSLIMAVFVIGQSCATLGLSVIVTRESAKSRDRASRYCVHAAAISLVAVLAAVMVLAPVVGWLIDDEGLRVGIQLCLLALVPSVATVFAESVLLGLGQSKAFVLPMTIENFLRAFLGVALVWVGYGIVALAASLLLLRLLFGALMSTILWRRGIGFRSLDFPLIRELLGQVPVLASIPVVNALYSRTDLFLLGAVSGVGDVGRYSAALRLVDVARILPMAFGRAFYPLASRAADADDDVRAKATTVGVSAVLVLVTPVAVIMSGLSMPLVTTVYGASLADAADVLAMMAWTLVPFALVCVLAQLLFAAGCQRFDLRVNVIAMTIGIGMNMVAIPRWGAQGAAIVSLATAVLYAALEYHYVRTRVGDPRLVWVLTRIAGISASSWVALLVVLRMTASPPAAGGVGLLVFLVGLFWSQIVTGSDVARLAHNLGTVGSKGFTGT